MLANDGGRTQRAEPEPVRERSPWVEDPGEWRDQTEDTLETRRMAPGPPRPELRRASTGLAPAPAWSPPVFAAAAWGGVIATGWLGLGPPGAAVVGAVVGGALGYRAARWPSGGLLCASAWTIGGIGAAAVIAPTVSAAAATWWDAGLAGVVLGAWAAGGPTEEAGTLWVPPAWVLSVLGVGQVAWRTLG